MRFLSIIGGILAAIIGVFLLIGVFVPETQYEVRVTIDRPANEVFEKFNDTANLRHWIDGFKRMELIDGELGKNGARYIMTIENGGKEHQFTQNSVTVKASEYCEFFISSDEMTSRTTVRFEADGQRTHITLINMIRGRDFISRAFLPLMRSTLQAQEQKHYDQLKTFVERQ